MNLLEMLTQKRTDPLSQFVAREKMIRRNPMKFVGDTATRLGGGDPDAGVLDLVRKREDVLGLPSLSDTEKTEIQGGFMETPEKKRADKAKRQGMIKGTITDIGSMFAGALEQEPERQLQFAPMQKQEFVPIIDPRWLPRRAKGGAVKKGQPYLVGEEGAEVVVPEEDGVVLPNPDTVDELGRQFGGNRANLVPQEEITQVETPTTDTITEEVKEPSLADKLGAEIKAYQDPDRYKKGSQFYDKKRNWKDALRSAGYGLLQSLASAPPTNDLGALLGRAIGGAGTGAVMGATMDNVDEKMRDQFKLAKLLPQYQNQLAMQKSQQETALTNARIANELAKPTDRDLDRLQKERNAKAVTERAKMNIEFRQGIAKPYIDENGKVWKQYLNDPKRPLEPLENPITHEQEFVPGEQGIPWTDPNTRQTYTIKAKQGLMPSATIATGNANRETNAARDNAEKYWQTQKTNIDNQMKYMSDIKGLLTAAITADSGMVDDPGTRAEMDGKLNEITVLSNSPLPESDDPSKAQEQRVKRVNELVDDYNKLNNKLLDNLSKSATGKAKADQIRAQIASMPRPAKLTYTPYQATMVTGGVTGKPVPPSKDPMGLFR